MDFDALTKDAEVALRLLPPQMLAVIPPVVLAHKDALEGALPIMFEMLKGHVQAAMMEGAMGVLDKGELEKALMLALVRAGVDVPQEPATSVRPPGW